MSGVGGHFMSLLCSYDAQLVDVYKWLGDREEKWGVIADCGYVGWCGW